MSQPSDAIMPDAVIPASQQDPHSMSERELLIELVEGNRVILQFLEDTSKAMEDASKKLGKIPGLGALFGG